ncbi:MAG: hypothetical protein U1E29_09915 [Coriobacteriia bacterium]|nr:hypothetical protein [Coriobacteriia bacterium]
MANKTKGPMAVNKSDTPAWMRVVIIAVVISFAAGGIAIVAAGIGGGSTPSTPSASGDSITAQFQPRVDAAVAASKSSPENPDVIAQVGHAYFEWAVALYEGNQVSASIPIWKSAVSYYDQALAIRPDDDVVLGNKAFALYYAQDAELAPAALQTFIDSAGDNAQLAAQVENARGMLAEFQTAAPAPEPSTP